MFNNTKPELSISLNPEQITEGDNVFILTNHNRIGEVIEIKYEPSDAIGLASVQIHVKWDNNNDEKPKEWHDARELKKSPIV